MFGFQRGTSPSRRAVAWDAAYVRRTLGLWRLVCLIVDRATIWSACDRRATEF